MTLFSKRTLLLALLALALPLFAASPEHMIGGTVPTPAPHNRGDGAVASDGTDFLVAWVDFRGSVVRSVLATRVTRGGEVLDPLGIPVFSTRGGILSLDMVWDGDVYLAVWTSWSAVTGSSRYNVYAARLDRDGKVVMQPRVVVEKALLTSYRSVATNGNVTVVSYYRDQQPYGVWIAALDRDGDVLHHEPLPIDSGQSGFAIAATPSRFVLTWSEANGTNAPETVHALALTGDGHVTGDPVLVGEGASSAIGTDGTRFLVVSIGAAVTARILDASLTPIGDATTIATDTVGPVMTVLWRAGRYEVDYYRHGPAQIEAFATELDADGHLITTLERDKPGFEAATNGSEVLVIFGAEVATSTHLQLFAALYRGNAAVADAHELLSWSGNAHTNPVVAASAHGHLVAWDEESGVYLTRVDAQGHSLDGRGVLLASKGYGVRVTFDGTNYVAAWIEEGGFGVRRIAPATGATVAEVHVPQEVWTGLAVAASPEATYVVSARHRLFVTRIPHATNVPDPMPLAVSAEETNVAAPAAAWNGFELLVTWNETVWTHSDPPFPLALKVLAARVTANLELLNFEPLVVAEADGDDWRGFGAPGIASDGDDWLIVADLGTMIGEKDVLARHVRRDGTLEGNAMVRIAGGANPAVTWDGTRYAVAWKDGETVRLGAIAPSGTPAATRQTVVATNAGPGTVSIAPAANGEAAVAYTKLSFLPQHAGVERTFLRFMDYGLPRGRAVRR